MTTSYRYVINRLRIDGRATDRVMLTRLGRSNEVTTAQGIEVGIRIENRGEGNARWSFAGQIDDAAPDLDRGFSRTDSDWLTFYRLDLSRYGA